MRPAEREAVETALRVMSKNNRKCGCSTGPDFEGPDRDCPVHGEKSGEDEYGKPLDYDDADVMYRITIKAKGAYSTRSNPIPIGSVTQFEMALDAAELDFLKRLSAASHEVCRVSTSRPRILIHRRVREGGIKDDANFAADA